MKLDLILENIRNKYNLGLLEESSNMSEIDLIKGKILINESTMLIRKMLIEEGVVANVQATLQESWQNVLLQENLGESISDMASDAYDNVSDSVSGMFKPKMVNDGMNGEVEAGSITHPEIKPITYVPPEPSEIDKARANLVATQGSDVTPPENDLKAEDAVEKARLIAYYQAGLGADGKPLGLLNQPLDYVSRAGDIVKNGGDMIAQAKDHPGMSTGAAGLAGLAGYGAIKGAGSVVDKLRQRQR